MTIITSTSLSDLAAKAATACHDRALHNLILHCKCPVTEVDGSFANTFARRASEWQQRTCPDHLFINHGQFIHRSGDGLQHIVQELRKKRDSSRACLSLISMQDIIGSHDDPIPSFMVLQFGFPADDDRLLVCSAYFRALEVVEFLPVNIAEMCLIIRSLRAAFPNFIEIDFSIHAFKAYAKLGFHCLEKAALDRLNGAAVVNAVEKGLHTVIQGWLESKINVKESVIHMAGLELLADAFEVHRDKYPHDLLPRLRSAIATMETLRSVREASSESGYIGQLEEDIAKELLAVRDLVHGV